MTMRIVYCLICMMVLCIALSSGTTHTITNSGFTFSPSTITISAGDTIKFVLASIHNAVEVSQATWNANDITSNGGFSVPFGGGSTVLSVVGTHYFVCQNHAPMGMKGIITVNPASPPPNSITVESFADHDGSLVTTNDRVLKNWNLKLYKDSVGSGVVLDSVVSGTSFTANNLSAGTYVAWEADSTSWSHISVTVDGSSQGATATNQWPLTVTSGQTHTIDFINFTPPPPNSLTIKSSVDQDGSVASIGDRVEKNWNLVLYKDSVGSGIVIGSVSSDTAVTINNLSSGTYVAWQADSTSWSHFSISVDGISQGVTASNQWPITVTSGETHIIEFINFTPHTIINSGVSFLPDSLNCNVGDTVHFVLESPHTAREVSEATWLANDTISDGGFDFPSGGGTFTPTHTGTYYYVCIVHVSIGMKGRIIVSVPPPIVSRTDSLTQGWDLISLPVTPANSSSNILFPTAVSSAFGYQGKYVIQSVLSNGVGYWLKFNSGQSVTVTGFDITTDSVGVSKGWNLIGSISSPLPKSAIITEPTGNIVSSLFGYNGSYFISDSILPGKGYWLKFNQQGTLIFDSSAGSSSIPKLNEDIFNRANTLTISDARGREQTLFLVDETQNNSRAGSFYELPPVPPAGGFDARFSSNRQLIVVGENGAREFPIEIASAQYPITIMWGVQSIKESIFLQADGERKVLHDGGAFKIVSPPRSLAVVIGTAEPLPTEYSLSDPYPNPFNPTTIIRYSIPVESDVLLRVYNILGQKIATLESGIQEAGTRSIEWNADTFGSGIYFVRLDAVGTTRPATSFTRVLKVILQK